MNLYALFAQTNIPPIIDPSEIPDTASGYWKVAILVLTPLVIWLFKIIMPWMPKLALPLASPLVGIGIEWLLGLAASQKMEGLDPAFVGAAGVALREGLDQALKLWRAKAAGQDIPKAGDLPTRPDPPPLSGP